MPRPVPHTANVDAARQVRVAPATEKRAAPQRTKGKRSKPKTAPATVVWRNSTSEQASSDAMRSPSSAKRCRVNLKSAKFRKSGVTRKMPIKSPKHQTAMVAGRLRLVLTPASTKVDEPIKPLIAAPKDPNRVRFRISRRRWIGGTNLPRRTEAATAGPRVFPTARNSAARWGIGVKKLARKAPTPIPKQTCGPKIKMAPSAMPAGGQIGETLPCVKGTASPILPATKYSTMTASDSKA